MCHAVFHLDSGVGGVGDGDGVVLADGWLVGDDLHLHGRRCRQRTHARVVRRPDGHLEERWAVGIITRTFFRTYYTGTVKSSLNKSGHRASQSLLLFF